MTDKFGAVLGMSHLGAIGLVWSLRKDFLIPCQTLLQKILERIRYNFVNMFESVPLFVYIFSKRKKKTSGGHNKKSNFRVKCCNFYILKRAK